MAKKRKCITNQSSSPTKNVGWTLRTKRASPLISNVMHKKLNASAISLAIPLVITGCACNTWTMHSYQPETKELDMSVCKAVLRDSRDNTKEAIDIAYKRANNLLIMRKDISTHNCTVKDGTLFYESRMSTASMKVICETPVKGRPFKGSKNFYFSVYRQNAYNVEINEEDILSTQ